MYPTINIGSWLSLYTFGLFMIIAWAIFFTILHYLSIRRGFSKHIFSAIIDFTLSIFLFGRIFYIISDWRTEKFLFIDLFETGNIFTFLKQFFITDNYSLTFAGGVIGFLIVFFWKTRYIPKDRPKYWDSIIPAFLVAGIVGYIGTLLGWQIYGIVMDTFFSITYTNPESIVPFQNPTFPLPILYSLFCVGIVYLLYRIETRIPVPAWFIGYIWMGAFSVLVFLAEFLNWASDLFSSRVYLNMTQLVTLGLISYSLICLLRIIKP